MWVEDRNRDCVRCGKKPSDVHLIAFLEPMNEYITGPNTG